MEIKALIVDDEKYERLLLSKLINWEEIGISLIGTAGSGQEAIEIFKDMHPEIILTDISMPETDGLELSRQIKKIDSKTKIVIITGFREFDYAKQAIRIGVDDFLLKPIEQKEVEKLLTKIRDNIVKERADRELINESIPLLAEDYVRKLLLGDEPQRAGKELFDDWRILERSNSIQVCVIKYAGSVLTKEDYEKTILTFRQFVPVFLHTWIYENETVLICPGQNKELYEKFEIKLSKSLTKYSVLLAVSNIYDTLKDVRKAYRESRKVILGSLRNMRPIIFFDDYEKMEKKAEQLSSKDFGEYVLAVREGDLDATVKFIDSCMSEYIKNDMASVIQLRNLGVILLYNTEKGLNEWGKSISDIVDENVYRNIVEVESLKEFCQRMNEILIKVTNYVGMLKSNTLNNTVQKCRQYIFDHMDTPGLSLKSIAEKLYLNESYLSRIFKQATGESVNRYLMRCRIEKSMELLSTTSLKAYEVGEQVGMPDAHYFGIAFKKYTGKTINEFRNRKKSKL